MLLVDKIRNWVVEAWKYDTCEFDGEEFCHEMGDCALSGQKGAFEFGIRIAEFGMCFLGNHERHEKHEMLLAGATLGKSNWF